MSTRPELVSGKEFVNIFSKRRYFVLIDQPVQYLIVRFDGVHSNMLLLISDAFLNLGTPVIAAAISSGVCRFRQKYRYWSPPTLIAQLIAIM